MKTLQEQYNLIKEGKGHKDVFLKEAKSRFPNMLTNSMNFTEAEKILTNRSVIQENYVDLKPITKIESLNGPKKDFELAFEKFLSEGEDQLSPIINDAGKPNATEIKTPAESKAKFSINDNGTGQFKENKEVKNSLDNQYPYSPSENNINNVSGQELINGVYYECKANPELGLREAQELVVKNLSKDPLHYVKEGQFGEAIGYQTENGGMKKNKGETYGGSGYSEKLEDSNNHYAVVKEDKEDKLKDLIKESLGGVVTTGNPNSLAAMYGQIVRDVMNEDEGTNVSYDDTNVALEARQKAIENSQERAGMEEEARPDYPDVDKDGDREESMEKALKDKKAKKVKKESIDSKLTEIGKQGDIVKLEAQLEYLSNHIDEKIDRVSSINEDDNLKELIDKSKMKAMQREIKLLEKRKGKMEKVYEKMCGKKYARKEMMDEDSNTVNEGVINEGAFDVVKKKLLGLKDKIVNKIGASTIEKFKVAAKKALGKDEIEVNDITLDNAKKVADELKGVSLQEGIFDIFKSREYNDNDPDNDDEGIKGLVTKLGLSAGLLGVVGTLGVLPFVGIIVLIAIASSALGEDSNANSNYGSNEGSNENSNDNPAVDQSYSGLEKFRQGVNEEEIDESFDSLAKKLDKQKGVDKEYAGKIAGKIANLKRKGAGKGPTAKQKKRMEEDNEVNWNDKNNPTKGPSGERDPRQVGQSVSPYSTTK